MQAELTEITDPTESLKWLAGGVMSLGSAWWNRILYGRKGSDSQVERVTSPAAFPIALILIAATFCAPPAIRRGLRQVFDTWAGQRRSLTPNQLEVMGRNAEAQRDAETLAFVALNLPVSQQSLHWADLAVSLDPDLTWVYAQMEGYIEPWRMSDSDFAVRVARLQLWDPSNAVPYVLQASRDFERNRQARSIAVTNPGGNWKAAEQFAADSVWSANMEMAFHASRFDDYRQRRFDMGGRVLLKQKITDPFVQVFSLGASKSLDLQAIEIYSAGVIHAGELREAAGDTAGANERYWQVAHFAQQMELGSRDDVGSQRLAALIMIEKSFGKLQSVQQSSGRVEDTKYAAYEVESARASQAEILSQFRRLAEEQRGL